MIVRQTLFDDKDFIDVKVTGVSLFDMKIISDQNLYNAQCAHLTNISQALLFRSSLVQGMQLQKPM